MFAEPDVPATVYGVATALKRSPAQGAAMQDAGFEIASYGLKWIEHEGFSPEMERREIAEAIRLHTVVTGERPRGWFTGRCSENTLDLGAGFNVRHFEFAFSSICCFIPRKFRTRPGLSR
jgi:peptidoglycan/xylan/chitin deacetylase (PgdA/CDA1 family)